MLMLKYNQPNQVCFFFFIFSHIISDIDWFILFTQYPRHEILNQIIKKIPVAIKREDYDEL